MKIQVFRCDTGSLGRVAPDVSKARTAFMFRVKQSSLALKIKTLQYLQTSGTAGPVTLYHNSEDLNPQKHCSEGCKAHTIRKKIPVRGIESSQGFFLRAPKQTQ
jgi:hypothetical protein